MRRKITPELQKQIDQAASRVADTLPALRTAIDNALNRSMLTDQLGLLSDAVDMMISALEDYTDEIIC